MPIDPQVAYNSLIAGAGAFLNKYPIRIFGATVASGVTGYRFRNRGVSKRPGTIMNTLRMKPTESFEIRSDAAMLGVPVVPGVPVNGHVFQAHSVHMDLGIGAMNFYNLGGGGPNIMVTGQLTGCSFIMTAGAGGSVNVAHVSPTGTTGVLLRAALAAANAGAQIYGVGQYDHNDRTVSIMGVRTGTTWRIYAQKHDATTYDYRIKSVYQIWPNRMKL